MINIIPSYLIRSIIIFVTCIIISILFGSIKIEYSVVAPGISWVVWSYVFYRGESKIVPIKDASDMMKYLVKFTILLMAAYLLWVVGLDSLFQSHENSASNIKNRDNTLIYILIISSLLLSITSKNIILNVYGIFEYIRLSESFKGKYAYTTLLVSTIVFLFFPSATKKVLDGGNFTIYRGDWTIVFIMSGTILCIFISMITLLRILSSRGR